MVQKSLYVDLIVLLFASFACFWSPLRAETVIRGGTLIDGTGRAPLDASVITIEGNKIKRVGKEGEVQVSPDATVIDASGKFVLPGLIDMHAHLRDWVGEIFLTHGVTTVLDLGNFSEWIFAQKEAEQKGLLRSPRIFAAGDKMDGLPESRALQWDAYNIGGIPYERFGLTTPQHATEVMRKQIQRYRIDGVKVYTTITPELLKAVAEQAHQAGLRVAGDLQSITAEVAIQNGLDCEVHLSNTAVSMIKDQAKLKRFREEQEPRLSYAAIDPWYLIDDAEMDSFIALLIRQEVWINPTIFCPWKGVTGREEEFDRYIRGHFIDPALSYIPRGYGGMRYIDQWTTGCGSQYVMLSSQEKEKVRRSYKAFQKFLRSYVMAGGKLLAGADSATSGVPGYGIHQEMALFVDAGLSPMQAILAATKWPAEYMSKLAEIGTIEEGKLADIIILRKNPLEHIVNSVTVETVIKNGQVQDIRYHSDYHNPIPRPPQAEVARGRLAFSNLILSPSPAVVPAGGPDLRMTVTGKYFFEDTTLYFKDTPLETKYINRGMLEGVIPASLIKEVGLYPIRVKLPAPSGVLSYPVYLLVKYR